MSESIQTTLSLIRSVDGPGGRGTPLEDIRVLSLLDHMDMSHSPKTRIESNVSKKP